MTNPISKVPGSNLTPAVSPETISSKKIKTSKENSAFAKIIENFSVNSTALRPNEIGVDKSLKLRSQVIAHAVNETIENPQHPYYSVGTEHREQMRQWIIEQLEPSHYLRSKS